MNKFIVFRMIFTLVSVGLIVFSLPNVQTYAQDKDSCRTDTEGWRQIPASDIDFSGNWTWVASTNCKNNWAWAGTITISGSPGRYVTIFDSKIEVTVSGSGVVFDREVEVSAGKDKNGANIQTWVGSLQRHEDGRIRIYGRWSGAFDYLIPTDYNKDFKMIKQ